MLRAKRHQKTVTPVFWKRQRSPIRQVDIQITEGLPPGVIHIELKFPLSGGVTHGPDRYPSGEYLWKDRRGGGISHQRAICAKLAVQVKCGLATVHETD